MTAQTVQGQSPAGEVSALSIKGLRKSFPGQVALNGVSLDVRAGEIHALVGENGSGKSTLIKCLAGYHHADPGGEVCVAGQVMEMPLTPARARAAGLAFVHQDLGLVPSMTVTENLAIGRGFETGAVGQIRWRTERRRARQVLEQFGHDIDPDSLVRSVSSSDQTLIAIIRGLQFVSDTDGHVLVLDEPTASLPEAEAQRLHDAIRKIARQGVGIIFVSHRLREVLAVSDRVSVLRDGELVETLNSSQLGESSLVRLMIGHEVEDFAGPATERASSAQSVLKVRGLSGLRVKDVSLDIANGEIVGLTGLRGSGRSELARLVTGAQAPSAGTISLQGRQVQLRTPADAIRNGVVYIPEDRRGAGSVNSMTLAENLTLPTLGTFWRRGLLRRKAERRHVGELIRMVDVRPRDPERRFDLLSGGNQQKAIIAKWLQLNPRLAVFDEPGQGVDVRAKAEIRGLIRAAADRGAGVLVVDSDVDEMLALCHRVVVIREGQVVDELAGTGLTKDRLTRSVLTRGATHV